MQKPILYMSIDIGDSTDIITLYQDQNPLDTATAFVKKHNLGAAVVIPLATHINNTLLQLPSIPRSPSPRIMQHEPTKTPSGLSVSRVGGKAKHPPPHRPRSPLFHQTRQERSRIQQKAIDRLSRPTRPRESLVDKQPVSRSPSPRQSTQRPVSSVFSRLHAEGEARQYRRSQRQNAQARKERARPAPPPPSDPARLYYQGMAAAERKRRDTQRMHRSPSPPSFRPTITPRAARLQMRGRPEHRLEHMGRRAAERRRRMKEAALEAELGECSFRPSLAATERSRSARRLRLRRERDASNPHSRLYNGRARIQAQRETVGMPSQLHHTSSMHGAAMRSRLQSTYRSRSMAFPEFGSTQVF
eukprot:gnl/Dysnectes_brevis/7782_a13390_265.p1 GENE.gnl/Dysnectes_brevis/7782_a13390_265~~gnl/Dysnectes_brevis/7782_a13390_265.p1  ORF type:complete len:359 (-),score=41.01 gnl/Dysnectes_brevis/7782_a13390_265:22-1098(-)